MPKSDDSIPKLDDSMPKSDDSMPKIRRFYAKIGMWVRAFRLRGGSLVGYWGMCREVEMVVGADVRGGNKGWCLGQVERSGLGRGQGTACRPIHNMEVPHKGRHQNSPQ